jgi:hypothetical protein
VRRPGFGYPLNLENGERGKVVNGQERGSMKSVKATVRVYVDHVD